jgi:hypothetical protein
MYYANPPRVSVYGEWMLADEGQDPAEVALPAYLLSRWNGWAVPAFPREAVDRVIAVQDQMRAADPNADEVLARLEWDGDAVIVTDRTYGEEYVDRIEPQTVGGEQVWDMGLGWTWDTLDFEDPARPTPEQREAFSALRSSLADGESVYSETALVGGDGSHTFAVQRERERVGSHVHMETVRRVTITRDGQTREEVKT